MPSPFDITTASNTVALDNKREGVAVFTVKNNIRRRIRAQARVTTQPPNAAAWLTILPSDTTSTDPANVRDFPVDGTQQIQVKIAAPADAPASSYSMKLTLADQDNPDDNFTDSPDVLFSIHEAPKPAPTPLPTWIIPAVLIGVAVIVVIILAGVALSKRPTGACQIRMKASQFVYSEPDTIANNMVDQLQPGADAITADSKSADNKWLAYPFQVSGIKVWIQKELLTTSADVSGNCDDLPVICLMQITGDQLTYRTPTLDPNNAWNKLTVGYQVVPVGKSSDGAWWQLAFNKDWIPVSAVGKTGKTSGDCNNLPVVPSA